MHLDGDTSDTPFQWTQPDLAARSHELRDPQGQVTARFSFDVTPGLAWSLRDPKVAVVQGDDMRWTFSVQRRGWTGFLGLTAIVTITGPQSGELRAGSFLANGRLKLGDDLSFIWRSSLARPGGSAFLSATLEPLVQFQPGSISERVNAYVHLNRATISQPHTLLLLGLGLYLRLLMGRPFR